MLSKLPLTLPPVADEPDNVFIKKLPTDCTSSHADAVDGTKIADDSIDSEHYADGSIDTAHISNDAITGAKIAYNAIEYEH